ncbi:Aste57867_19814 [Aphanomyces stellatus]|uniref:Aste57867_19814 protein n=1 Tax=Aphanomyces stellatus TaxID=120398 RepID=A0A485LEZ6_9STRA|nr:hypothetical protein As57867_019749 [Aphanomyces stellatus]VFT96512.1 Aste57867_19814 [Aphanomyces stellatus]
MSLLDLPIDVISMDEAEDRAFDVDLAKVEMGEIGLTPDVFRPSHNLVEDGFDDGVDDFGGLHLDSMSFDTLSFYEYGPFSPTGSPKAATASTSTPAAESCVEKVQRSFTHNEHKDPSLPPKYFKTVRSSPQKRRVVSRTLNQIKKFSFAPKTDAPPAAVPTTPAVPTAAPKPIAALPPPEAQKLTAIAAVPFIKEEPMAEPEPAATKTPVRVLSRSASTPIVAKSSPLFTTPLLQKAVAPSDLSVSPQDKSTSRGAASVALLDVTKLSVNQKNVSLPPRYLQGPNSSPEKKRVHSITFGKAASFSFSPSKSPKTSLPEGQSPIGLRRSQSQL